MVTLLIGPLITTHEPPSEDSCHWHHERLAASSRRHPVTCPGLCLEMAFDCCYHMQSKL